MVEFIEYFNISKVYAAWISSLMMAVIAVVGKTEFCEIPSLTVKSNRQTMNT